MISRDDLFKISNKKDIITFAELIDIVLDIGESLVDLHDNIETIEENLHDDLETLEKNIYCKE